MESPRKKPPFSPRKPSRAASPPGSDDDAGYDDAIRPQGCALILRGLYVPGSPITTTSSVALAQTVVNDLMVSDPSLPSVSVSPFSLKKPSSSCYLRIMEDTEETDTNPRFDLLEVWLLLLREKKLDWEVAWQPLADGKDKRMTIRFTGEEFKTQSNTKCPALEKAKAALQSKGIPFTDAFSLPSGSHITLADPRHIDDILQAGAFLIPDLAKEPIPVMRSRQIEIEHCFEVVITGLSEGDGLQSQVCRWIAKMVRDPSDDQTCYVGCRHPPLDSADYLIVWLSDWSATVRLLTMGEKMKKAFLSSAPSFHVPQLVFAFNNGGAWRAKPLAQTFREGAESMNDSLRALRAELHEFKRESRAQHESTQRAFDAMSRSVGTLTRGVEDLSGRMVTHSSAMMSLSMDAASRSQLAQVQMQISQLQMVMRFGLEDEKEDAKAEYLRLRQEQSTLTATISASSRKTLSLLGTPIGADLGTPPVPPGLVPVAGSSTPSTGSRDRPSTPSTPSPPSKRAKGTTNTDSDVLMPAVSISSPPASLTLIAARNVSSGKSVKCSTTNRAQSRGIPFRDFHGVLSFASVKELPRLPTRVQASCKESVSSIDFKIPPLLIVFVIILSLVDGAWAATAPPRPNSGFSIYALNMNGLGGPGKMSHLNSVISMRSPHAFVISETKANGKLSSKFPSDYNIFEEDGVPLSHGRGHKWGVAVGIRRDFQVSQRVPVNKPSLKGRLLAIDIVLPTDRGRGFVHRVIGIYAPWDPGINNLDTNARQFWSDLTEFCNQTATSWSMAGDYNATVSSKERAADNSDARTQFVRFLRDTNAHDLWSDVHDRDRKILWTSRARGQQGGGNIIDRIVSSASQLADSEIGVADRYTDFVPATDHRAVIGKLVYLPPSASVGLQTAFHDIPQVFNQPRLKFPFKSEKHRFTVFSDAVDQKIKATDALQYPVVDDDSFIQRYEALTAILIPCAEDIFGRNSRYKRNLVVMSPKIQAIVSSIRGVGGAIRHVKSDYSAPMSRLSSRSLVTLDAEYSRISSPLSFLQFLVARRRQLHKDLYAEKMAEIYARAKLQDRNRMAAALHGGSTKRLVPTGGYASLPRSISAIDDPEKLLSEPEAVMEETREYFTKLYGRLPTVACPKPWMTTPSVADVKNRVTADPFVWPRPASIAQFRALLRRGNQRPSPGPDQWEKWLVKALSDDALSLVLDLHNYVVMNSRFPGNLKDMWITMFHKRGLLTNLSNWRGLFLSNFLANSPISWLTTQLTAYSSRMGIVPETQVAVQQGVQTRDLMSFLAGIQTWAERHKETVVVVKRDQMKGFDYLSPEGFYDAIRAYGLPESIIDLDRAAQTNTACRIRTYYGPTSPIVVDGVTKQGGPASPLKAIFTTSLGHRYLDDIAAQDPDALVITTATSRKGDPHTPLDSLIVTVPMTEATDDSCILARSVRASRKFCLHMERFQFAYGWLTQWLKTFAYILNDRDPSPPSHISYQSVTVRDGVDPWTISEYDVPVIRTGLDFLNTKVDDPGARLAELKEIIDSFTFPRMTGRLPITLLRKLLAQNVISRCRALLSLQPIRQVDAEALDSRLSMKIHGTLGMPFPPSPRILTLPISLHGLGLPSISRINAGIAIDGLYRDLNHHIPAYRGMARITLADWTCSVNGCVYPLDGIGLEKTFARYVKKIPAAWIIAQAAMAQLDEPLSLRKTDHSHILRGDVSISHVVALCNHHSSEGPDGNTLRTLRSKGIRTLADAGRWCSDSGGAMTFVVDSEIIRRGRWSAVQRTNWQKVTDVLHEMKSSSLFDGPEDLLLSRDGRRERAEDYIRALVTCCDLQPSLFAPHAQTWATDGSMVPAMASLSEPRSVIAAATGSSTLVLRLSGRNLSILQGELMGQIIGLVLDNTTTSSASCTSLMLSDHQNSVNLLNDIRSGVSQESRLRGMNGRSYYRWILKLISGSDSRVEMEYTRGHSTELSIRAQMNREADFYASGAQRIRDRVPQAPLPTFTMDDYTFYRAADGWIESNIRTFVDHFMASQTAVSLAVGNRLRMLTAIHDRQPPPDYPYTRALSAHSAVIQLYARSGQLPTADVLEKRSRVVSPMCRSGCGTMESPHHLFVDCCSFDAWRLTAKTDVRERTRNILVEAKVDVMLQLQVLQAAESLFLDDPRVWPLKISQYYVGQIPSVENLLPIEALRDVIARRRITSRISKEWHTTAIRLAGRIFGSVQRTTAAQKALLG